MIRLDASAILQKFGRLALPKHPDALLIERLRANLSIGRLGDGSPAMFFALKAKDIAGSRRVTRSLETIESSNFSVIDPQGRAKGQRSGYALVLRDQARLDSFATIAAHAASRLGADAGAFSNRSAIDDYVEDWIEFFTLGSVTIERAIGLWGELLLLESASDPNLAVPTWVGPFGEMFDFFGNGVSIEVKTSLRSSVVWFSLEQIANRDGGHSVFIRVLRDDVAGRTLDEIASEIRAKLSDVAQFDAALMRAGYRVGDHPELRLTEHEMFAIPNGSIPRPTVKDRRIRNVRYAVDVDGLERVEDVSTLLDAMTGRRRARKGPIRRPSR